MSETNTSELSLNELKAGLLKAFKRGVKPDAGTQIKHSAAVAGAGLVKLSTHMTESERNELRDGLTGLFRLGQSNDAGTRIVDAAAYAGYALAELDIFS